MTYLPIVNSLIPSMLMDLESSINLFFGRSWKKSVMMLGMFVVCCCLDMYIYIYLYGGDMFQWFQDCVVVFFAFGLVLMD